MQQRMLTGGLQLPGMCMMYEKKRADGQAAIVPVLEPELDASSDRHER